MSYTPEFEQAEETARLSREVEKLPPEQKQVIYGRFTLGKSICEIAEELRRSEGAIKQLQFRAIKKLRAALEGLDA
jgi:RNA polymerase sigma-70 factor (ECF subfamily)